MKFDCSNYLIDVIDQFRAQANDEARWDVAQKLITDLGGSALNIGLIEVESSIPVWIRSSMSQEWLEAYVNDGHYLVDPFLPHLKNSMQVISAKGGSLSRNDTHTDAEIGLNWGLKDAGYAYLAGLPFAGEGGGSKRMITFCSDEDPDNFEHSEFRDKLNCLSTVIAAFMAPPEENLVEDAYIVRFRSDVLTAREIQVLRFLALGDKNNVIAWRMDIAEVTVRKHILSARRKLGANTREQAVAIAVKRDLISF